MRCAIARNAANEAAQPGAGLGAINPAVDPVSNKGNPGQDELGQENRSGVPPWGCMADFLALFQ